MNLSTRLENAFRRNTLLQVILVGKWCQLVDAIIIYVLHA